MKNLKITVVNKVATFCQRGGFIVCGNSDYQITFAFDAEWNEYPVKTARFKWNDTYTDVPFEGSIVNVPIIQGTSQVEVGVFSGELHTTTPAEIPCVKSILCGYGTPAAPPDDVYSQIIEMINGGINQGSGGTGVNFKLHKIPRKEKFEITPGMIALILPYGDYTLSAHRNDDTTIVSNMGATLVMSTDRGADADNPNDYWVAFLYIKTATLMPTMSTNHNLYTANCYIKNNDSGTSGTGYAYVYYLSRST